MTTPPGRPERPAFPPFEMPAGMGPEYSNLVRVSHSISEIVLDFGQMFPGQQTPRMISRLVMSPLGAKLFYRALGENLARYEAAFGEIVVPSSSGLAGDLFRQVQPPSPGGDDKNTDQQPPKPGGGTD